MKKVECTVINLNNETGAKKCTIKYKTLTCSTSLAEITKKDKEIKNLEINTCEIQTFPVGIINLFPSLTDLSIKNSNLTDFNYSHVKELKNLKNIELTGNKLNINSAIKKFLCMSISQPFLMKNFKIT